MSYNKTKNGKNNNSKAQQKATVNAEQLSHLKRKRFVPVLLITLVIAFLLPTFVFMTIHYLSASTHGTEPSYASVLGEFTEAQESESYHDDIDSTEVLTHSDSTDEPLPLSLPERYPEVFPELFPELFPEHVPEERSGIPRIEAVTGVKVAYLTFDDGPSKEITPGILDLLSKEGIKATFFVLPRNGVDDIYLRIIEEGHEIGNHSYSHNYTALYNRSDEDFREDIIQSREFISTNFDYNMTAFRFPGGSMSWKKDVIETRVGIIEELGYKYFDWHIDSGDAHPRQADKSAETLASNVLDNTNGIEHVIVLMHDSSNKDTSLEALPAIIRGLREQGYIFDLIRNYPDN